MKVLQFPLARITIGFVLGILITYYLKLNTHFVFASLFISFCTFIFAYLLSKKGTKYAVFFGITTFFLSIVIGGFTQIIHTDSYQQSNYTHHKNIFEKSHLMTVVIREKLKNSSFSNRYIAIINHVDGENRSGRILLNIRKDSLKNEFEIGTNLRINGLLLKNKTSNNPNQFDYGKYLDGKQIYAQLYCDVNEVQIGTETEKNIWYYAANLRTKIIRNLEKSNFNKTELNVAIALIMGQQQDISPEIIKDYQYAGAVHILSVSGLHIGFILLFITFILKPLPNTRRGAFLKLIIVLASLSLFGILAGLAPSVIRSVVMFSFVAIGMYLRRSTNIFHTLLVSVLLILLFQPSFLFDVGFQLSYIALFFILWLQPLLSSLWIPKNKIASYFWDIITVSFAAQIGAFPLSVYYFHQFPGLFFVTNLIIIPFLTVIMALGVLVMVLAALDYVPTFLAKLLELSIYYMDKIINSIASFEQFIIRDIAFNTSLLITVYFLIFTSVLWLKKPNFNKLVLVLIAIISIQISYLSAHYTTQNQQEWVVFNSKKTTLIVERNGENVTIFANDSILKTAQNNKPLSSYLVANFSALKTKVKLQNLAFYKNNKILILDSLAVYPKNITPDIIVLTQSPKINLDRLLQTIKPKIIVADGSNYKTIQKFWMTTCNKQKIPLYSTSEKGFYVLN